MQAMHRRENGDKTRVALRWVTTRQRELRASSSPLVLRSTPGHSCACLCLAFCLLQTSTTYHKQDNAIATNVWQGYEDIPADEQQNTMSEDHAHRHKTGTKVIAAITTLFACFVHGEAMFGS